MNRNPTTGDLYHHTIDIDRNKLVGFFMPVLNCKTLLEGTYNSLVNSMPKYYPFGMIAIDTGSTDGTKEYIQQQVPTYGPFDLLPYDVCGPTAKDSVPNVAVELWLGKYDKSIDKFEHEDAIKYLCWIHSDMDFVTHNWLEKMIDVYESDPNICFLSPTVVQHETRTNEYQANAAPLLISVQMMKNFYRRYGFFLDPSLHWCVAYDDWDMHFRVKEMGFKSLVTHRVKVIHYTGGTTLDLARRGGWDKWRNENFLIYQRKWKTDKQPFPAGEWGIKDGYTFPDGKIYQQSDYEYSPIKELTTTTKLYKLRS